MSVTEIKTRLQEIDEEINNIDDILSDLDIGDGDDEKYASDLSGEKSDLCSEWLQLHRDLKDAQAA